MISRKRECLKQVGTSIHEFKWVAATEREVKQGLVQLGENERTAMKGSKVQCVLCRTSNWEVPFDASASSLCSL